MALLPRSSAVSDDATEGSPKGCSRRRQRSRTGIDSSDATEGGVQELRERDSDEKRLFHLNPGVEMSRCSQALCFENKPIEVRLRDQASCVKSAVDM